MAILAIVVFLLVGLVAQVQSECADTDPVEARSICEEACNCVCGCGNNEAQFQICVQICENEIIGDVNQCRTSNDFFLENPEAPKGRCDERKAEDICARACDCCNPNFPINNPNCVENCERNLWWWIGTVLCAPFNPLCSGPAGSLLGGSNSYPSGSGSSSSSGSGYQPGSGSGYESGSGGSGSGSDYGSGLGSGSGYEK